MVEFTMTFSGPKKCAHCDGPIGEVACFDEHGAYCDSVCANAAAVERKAQEQHGPPLTPLELAEAAVIKAAKAAEESLIYHVGDTGSVLVGDLVDALEALEKAEVE